MRKIDSNAERVVTMPQTHAEDDQRDNDQGRPYYRSATSTRPNSRAPKLIRDSNYELGSVLP